MATLVSPPSPPTLLSSANFFTWLLPLFHRQQQLCQLHHHHHQHSSKRSMFENNNNSNSGNKWLQQSSLDISGYRLVSSSTAAEAAPATTRRRVNAFDSPAHLASGFLLRLHRHGEWLLRASAKSWLANTSCTSTFSPHRTLSVDAHRVCVHPDSRPLLSSS